MQKEGIKFTDENGGNKEFTGVMIAKKTFRDLFYYSNCGLQGLKTLDRKEISLLSKSSKKGIYIAKYSYLNIISELKKAEALNLVENFEINKLNDINQTLDIKIFVRKLCRRITAVVGATANLKVRFTSNIDNNSLAQCDASILQFVLTNCIAVIAANISKDKRIINVQLDENEDNICVKIWNKYAFRPDKKIIDKTDALKMYVSDYELEQMKVLSNTLVSVMNASAEPIVEDNIFKMMISLCKCDDVNKFKISEADEEIVSDMQIVIPFSGLLLKCVSDLEEIDEQYCKLLDFLM